MENEKSIETKFADELLMPKQKIEELVNNGVTDLIDLSDALEVPLLEIHRRVLELGYKVKRNT